MSRSIITNAILWAAAVIAAAIMGAPSFLTLLLLPSLAFVSLVLQRDEELKAERKAARVKRDQDR